MLFLIDLVFQMAMKAEEGKKHERVISCSGAASTMSSVAAGTGSRPEKLQLQHMRRANAESVVTRGQGGWRTSSSVSGVAR